jgi:hypothetical protein
VQNEQETAGLPVEDVDGGGWDRCFSRMREIMNWGNICVEVEIVLRFYCVCITA